MPDTRPVSARAGGVPVRLTCRGSSSGGTGTAAPLCSLPEGGLWTSKPCLRPPGAEVSGQANSWKEEPFFKIIPETVGGALTLAPMGGLDRRVLEMEIISRDFFFQARPHLRHP